MSSARVTLAGEVAVKQVRYAGVVAHDRQVHAARHEFAASRKPIFINAVAMQRPVQSAQPQRGARVERGERRPSLDLPGFD